MSLPKTEWMWVPGISSNKEKAGPRGRTLTVKGHTLPQIPRTEAQKDGSQKETKEFKYLGSMLAPNIDLGVEEDIDRRISLASMVFAKLRPVWTHKILSIQTKAKMMKSVVASTLLWGAESWPIKAARRKKLQQFWNRCCRNLRESAGPVCGTNTYPQKI